MALDPWHKVATPRKEVREGRSFNPDEFAIALEQVISGNAPEDYRDPEKFFARTCFTRALKEHSALVLRRLAGETANTAPVLTLITQFGGGKTHTLTALYHLAKRGEGAKKFPGVADLLSATGLSAIPQAKVAVFVGNAWDPKEGRETPWIDLARQIAGDEGVRLLGPAAKEVPPGTETLGQVFRAAKRPVLVLMDEVLNFLDRNKRRDAGIYDAFHAFIQNLTVALTGMERCAALISLPRSQVEMSAEDQIWQDRITKVVKRVAKDLIVSDEAEIGEVIRRRLFEDLGNERTRKRVAKEYADWCFERRAQLPPEWTAVDTAATEAKAREQLQQRFETCYPFHPATLSVFQRKWQSLQQFQQTRGTLAMFAQWIAAAQRDAYAKARYDALIWALRRCIYRSSAAWCSVSSERRDCSPRSRLTLPAPTLMRRRLTRMPRVLCMTSTGASARRFFSSLRVGRRTRARTFPSCASRSAIRCSIPPRSIRRRRTWRRRRTTCAAWVPMVSLSATSQR
jgi:predicted AAA+ superfamily ATPase